jgi:hypothetical protein
MLAEGLRYVDIPENKSEAVLKGIMHLIEIASDKAHTILSEAESNFREEHGLGYDHYSNVCTLSSYTLYERNDTGKRVTT